VDFRGVIFDLDGTLLNTLDDLADSMNAVLAKNRLPVHPAPAYRQFVGDGIEMLVRRALPADVADENEFSRFVKAMKEEYACRWALKTRPYPGIAEMLDAFATAGFEMAVLSNKPDDASRHIVETFLSDVPFRCVLGAFPERPKKPDPGAALEIADRLRLPPAQFIFIGDTSIDMRTARAAGMFPLGVLWGFRGAQELIAAGAELLVNKPTGLIPWIARA
jgi:phosphoglycolate phosphatase